MERLQRQLAHELGPAIHVVGVVRRPDHLLGEVQLLGDVLLDVVGIHATGRGEDELLDVGIDRRLDHQTIDDEVAAALGIVHLHVTPTAVDGGEVEDVVDAPAGPVRHASSEQVRIHELDHAAVDMAADVVERSAREVVDDADLAGAPLDQLVDDVRTDERRSAGHQDVTVLPVSHAIAVAILVGLQCSGLS